MREVVVDYSMTTMHYPTQSIDSSSLQLQHQLPICRMFTAQFIVSLWVIYRKFTTDRKLTVM